MMKPLLPILSLATAITAQYQNPVLWEDLADIDILRVDDAFYYSASTMHYSPGAPILRSYDLVNWEYAGHSVPELDWGDKYNLNGGRAYVKGIWASTLNYRPSTSSFYWGGCIESGKTYMYTAPAVEGPWERHDPPIDRCYYDAGLLVDDDDALYVAYGNTEISVARLSEDGFSEVENRQVFTSDFTIEGARFYKIDGKYYILVTRPPDAQFVLMSTAGPFGPYTMKPLVDRVASPVPETGAPHQGGIVDTPNGDWYYMAFIDAYPGGRLPVLAPIIFDADGWPSVQLVNGGWGASYPMPTISASASKKVKRTLGTDTFNGTSLSHEWEWNHNPDTTKYSVDNGLYLQAATVTDDLYAARNTLTRRIPGPASTATIILDIAGMLDGDHAGLTLLRQSSAWIGIKKDAGGAARVVMVNGITMTEDWETDSKGEETDSVPVPEGAERVWLRARADIDPSSAGEGSFEYSVDGEGFLPLGDTLVFNREWQFFMGYRFGIFYYATQELGGTVVVEEFEVVVA
ncbi:hypothetical protein AJ79_05847 [Helicocarpus griseus UAMH5409]|uniref:Beta-xylosidase C-terminal Concanavalin A-like domain-containing protein n=1 Tax=Helicocarpus griseus UAMH5409 TaxID=1447875 RepID=A0A2B7XJA8_9EURO|nr:hypothetical protein AJ79_05847 [Helicocarpus griseus UAMH5409]